MIQLLYYKLEGVWVHNKGNEHKIVERQRLMDYDATGYEIMKCYK